MTPMRTWTQPSAPRFWAALAAGQFELPRCERCGAWQGPDAAACLRCESPLLAWAPAASTGTVFSVMEPWARGAPAQTIAVIDLDAGPRMMGALTGASSVGMRVAALLGGETRDDRLPLFEEFVR